MLRLSGPDAGTALRVLAGGLPPPRRASLRVLRDRTGGTLDQAMVLWLPGPGTVTGEDMAELHLHGGRAVIAAVEAALCALPKLRRATAGEFTRRAFANGKVDLAEAEGLADLLAAETELQRASAVLLASGRLSQQVEAWRDQVLALAARVEAVLDFSDEDDVDQLPQGFARRVAELQVELTLWLARPRAEALREGFRVVIAGPPNAGKSTLFNVLVGTDAAITSPFAGTTRDVLVRPVAIESVPFTLVDTAGLRAAPGDPVEAIGIARAEAELACADLVLWLGPVGEGPTGAWEIVPQTDREDHDRKCNARHRISALTGAGVGALVADLVREAARVMPKPGEVALNARQHQLISSAAAALGEAVGHPDPLIVAECLRRARAAFDALVGRSTVEDVLDALFGRFCIGK